MFNQYIYKLRSAGLKPTKQRLLISKLLFGRKETFHFTVENLAKIAKETKVGVVCSGHEAKIVRKTIGPDLLIFTPGIRLKNNDKDDQKRICTPSESIKNGVDKIIMGRSLIKGDIEENFNKVLNSLKSVNSL